MFYRQLKRISLATIAALALASGAAQAAPGDVIVTNSSAIGIHPYFKSNCWNPDFLQQGADEWVFFGFIRQVSQFNWDRFYLLLDPKCKNPVVKFTFTHPGEPAPGATDVQRTVVMHYDATEEHIIRLGNKVVVTEVLP